MRLEHRLESRSQTQSNSSCSSRVAHYVGCPHPHQVLSDGLHYSISSCMLNAEVDVSTAFVCFPSAVGKFDGICRPNPEILNGELSKLKIFGITLYARAPT